MSTARRVAAFAAAGALASWCGGAQAYRPFDETNADIAGPDQVVVELAPAGYLREGPAHTLLAPSAVVNWGFARSWQAVFQGQVVHDLAGGVGGTSLVGNTVSLTHLMREGSVQDATGPSITAQFGVLLPGIRDDHGTGASASGAISQQWDWGAIHLNAAASVTREHHADVTVGAIVEGPNTWPVRPVAEIFYERDFGGERTRSALVGAIWQLDKTTALDVAVRGARINNQTAGEIRAGVTFQFGVP